MVAHVGTNASIPANHTRHTALDGRFAKSAPAATGGGATSGSATHDHPFPAHTHGGSAHSHAGGTSGNYASNSAPNANLNTGTDNLADASTPNGHNHPYSTSTDAAATSGTNSTPSTWDTASSDPPYFEVIFVKATANQAGIPNLMVAWWNSASLPSGWRACDGAAGAPDLRNRFMKGAAGGGNGGATGGGSDVHSHANAGGHTHPSGGTHSHTTVLGAENNTNAAQTGSNNFSLSTSSHVHTGTASTDAIGPTFASAVANNTATGDGQPPWSKSYAIQNNSGAASLPLGIIAMWNGTLASIPAGWAYCDGTNGTPDLRDKYVKALNTTGELGNTGGAATHTHGNGATHLHSQVAHIHAYPANSADGSDSVKNNNGNGTFRVDAHSSHTHTIGGSTPSDGAVNSGSTAIGATANADNKPLTTEVVYAQLKNNVLGSLAIKF